MTDRNENPNPPKEGSAETAGKNAYRTPELTVHGRVDEITQHLLALSPH